MLGEKIYGPELTHSILKLGAHMLGTQNLLLFVASGILLNLTPGQDTFYILGRSVVVGGICAVRWLVDLPRGVPVKSSQSESGAVLHGVSSPVRSANRIVQNSYVPISRCTVHDDGHDVVSRPRLVRLGDEPPAP